jgi:predicted PurR-regulated permease PerM
MHIIRGWGDNLKENKNEKYIKGGLTIFFSLSAVILVYMGISKLHELSQLFTTIKNALQPIFIGLILAYLVAPLESKLERFLKKKKLKESPAKTISIFTTVVAMLFIIIVAVKVIFPQVMETIMDLTTTLPGMINSFIYRLQRMVQNDSQLMLYVQEAAKRFNEWFKEWSQNGIYDTLTQVLNGVLNVFGFLVNIVIGFIVMIYVLFEKEHFRGQAKKLLYAVSKNRKVNAFLLDTVRQCDKMFGGFITGKLIDSLIIGILCFICMSVMKFPYVALISLIVGVTNVIPFFGPYIGAIPSAFLILLVDPMKCVEFIIFVLILQQIDGNIIGPRILGQSTGLSPFWVLFSILLFGELMGVIGMVIGVPLFATIYYVIKRLVETSLKLQNLPAESSEYILLDKLDDHNYATFLSETTKSKRRRKSSAESTESKKEEGEKE